MLFDLWMKFYYIVIGDYNALWLMNVILLNSNHWLLYNKMTLINQSEFAGPFKKILYKYHPF
jgi:hypothetical protein